MQLKTARVTDSQFVSAEISMEFGSIRVEAELLPGDLPCHIDSISMAEDGTPWSGYSEEQEREIRSLIHQVGAQAVR